MKKLTVEECERISISTIVRKQIHHVIKLIPDISLEELNSIIVQRLDNINCQSIIHGYLLKLSFTTTVPHFGGVRYWFVCPYCDRRVGTLYSPRLERYFKCRHCHNLTYKSTQNHDHRVNSILKLVSKHPEYAFQVARTKPRLFLKAYDKNRLTFHSPYLIRRQKEEEAYNKYIKPLMAN